jgi:predicted AAA+ superfamily ATPase
LVSSNKLFNDLKSRGLRLSKNTIYEYLSHLEDAYGAFTIPIYGNSVSEEMRNPRKIYSVDIGFKRVMDFAFRKDIGYIYENIVFLELRRHIKEIFYFKKKQEVDFFFETEGKPNLINVSYNIIEPATRKREITGLMEAMDYFSIDNGLIITAETEEEITEGKKNIRIIPLWKWLLSSHREDSPPLYGR